MSLKVLPLPAWAKSSRFDPKYYTPANTVFNRPGIYLCTPTCWFERPDGTAYKYDEGHFRYELELLDVGQRYNQRQIDALRHAIRENVATRHQRHVVYMWGEFHSTFRINVVLHSLRREKHLIEKREHHS